MRRHLFFMCGKKKYLGALVLLFASVHFNVFAQSESESVVSVVTEAETVTETVVTEVPVVEEVPKTTDDSEVSPPEGEVPPETLPPEPETTDVPVVEATVESEEVLQNIEEEHGTSEVGASTTVSDPSDAEESSGTGSDDSVLGDDFVVTETLPESVPADVEPKVELPTEQVVAIDTPAFMLVNLDPHFRLDEQIVFVFSTNKPAPPDVDESEGVGFIERYVDPILDGMVEYSKDIVEHVIEVTETVVDAVTDLIIPETQVQEVSDVVSVDADQGEQVVPATTELIAPNEELPVSEENQDTTNGEGSVTDSGEATLPLDTEVLAPDSATTSEATGIVVSDEVAIVSMDESAIEATTTPVSSPTASSSPYTVLVDGMPVEAPVVWSSDTDFSVTLPSSVVSPGQHTFHITYIQGDTVMSTTTQFTFGGQIDLMQKLTETDIVAIEHDVDRGQVLWLLDSSNILNVYEQLAAGEQLENNSPVTYKEGNILWLSKEGRSVVGYDTVSHTTYSQSYEENPEVGIMLQTGSYAVDVDNNLFNFEPVLPAE